ncbi:MAG: hypothetical protein KDA80_02260 [Planctomycetaceae bacterium]|nr:hypothetical protein [Planctomycetaceae bacterium]
MATRKPFIVIIGGPNGSGKSTSAPPLVKKQLKINQRENHDPVKQFADIKATEREVEVAVAEAIRQHLRAGRQIPVWQNGQVVWVTPEIEDTPTEEIERG